MAGIRNKWHLLPGTRRGVFMWELGGSAAFYEHPFRSNEWDWVNLTIKACTQGQKCSQAFSYPLRRELGSLGQGPQLENFVKSLNACLFLRSQGTHSSTGTWWLMNTWWKNEYSGCFPGAISSKNSRSEAKSKCLWICFQEEQGSGKPGSRAWTLALEPGQWEARIARGTEAEQRQGLVGGSLRALRAGAGAQQERRTHSFWVRW